MLFNCWHAVRNSAATAAEPNESDSSSIWKKLIDWLADWESPTRLKVELIDQKVGLPVLSSLFSLFLSLSHPSTNLSLTLNHMTTGQINDRRKIPKFKTITALNRTTMAPCCNFHKGQFKGVSFCKSTIQKSSFNFRENTVLSHLFTACL